MASSGVAFGSNLTEAWSSYTESCISDFTALPIFIYETVSIRTALEMHNNVMA